MEYMHVNNSIAEITYLILIYMAPSNKTIGTTWDSYKLINIHTKDFRWIYDYLQDLPRT